MTGSVPATEDRVSHTPRNGEVSAIGAGEGACPHPTNRRSLPIAIVDQARMVTPGFSSGSPMGRDQVAFGMSLAARAIDAHENKRKHTTACSKICFFKNPPV
jgi:hypothetical protein